jgi:methylated-DNA-[protein]-cysteine S-methyltransferase
MKKLYPEACDGREDDVSKICRKLTLYFQGVKEDFTEVKLNLTDLSSFQRKVLLAERRTPYGRVTTYGRLAVKIGKSGSARAVGSALARNPFPLVIPCHRTIRADGSLGGFQGGGRLKRTLLELEGVIFDTNGRVSPVCMV